MKLDRSHLNLHYAARYNLLTPKNQLYATLAANSPYFMHDYSTGKT